MNLLPINKAYSLKTARLVYNGALKISEAASSSSDREEKDVPVLKAAAEKAAENVKVTAREKAVDMGRERARAVAPSATPTAPTTSATPTEVAPTAPSEQKKLPAIPPKLKGLQPQGETRENKGNGTVEQDFKFGDLDIPGKITLPAKPEEGKKTTVVFNYVQTYPPNPEQEKKFFERLKQTNVDLGNTVVVTVKTPEGKTRVEGQDVNTMATLMGELERFQEDLKRKNDGQQSNLARAETVLHLTTSGEKQKVGELMRKYYEAAAENDSRLATAGMIIDSNPDNLAASLEAAVMAMEQPVASVQSAVRSESVGSYDSPSGSGSGGSGGYGGSGSDGRTDSGTDSGADVPDSNTTETGDQNVDQAPENREMTAEGVGHLLVFGDSLMHGAIKQGKLNEKRTINNYGSVAEGKHLKSMRSNLENLDRGGKVLPNLNMPNCRGTILVRGGGNDLAGGVSADEIFKHMEAMAKIAKKNNLKIYFCALTPFGGTTNQILRNNYEEKNNTRIEINRKLYAMAEGDFKNIVGVIPLDKKVSEGGLASEEDTNRLHKDVVWENGDNHHLSGEGYKEMARIINTHLGEQRSKEDEPPVGDTGTAVASSPSPSPTSAPTDSSVNTSEWEYVKDHQSVAGLASEYQKKWLRAGHPVGHQEIVNDNDTEYLLTVMPHQVQARSGKRVSDRAYQSARNANWPLNQVGRGWLYAVEVKQRRPPPSS